MSPFPRLETAFQCLARERSLHETAEQDGGEYVWVWEVEAPAVVMGRSADCDSEVHQEACAKAGVPVLRRDSGGRTVLLGKGCLVYTLILGRGERTLEKHYRLILDAVMEAANVREAKQEAYDLTVHGRKFGGCAQRRRRHTVLHHGTLLYDFDIASVGRYLAEPRRQPAYREKRTHSDFLTNVDVDPDFARRLAAQFPEAVFVE